MGGSRVNALIVCPGRWCQDSQDQLDRFAASNERSSEQPSGALFDRVEGLLGLLTESASPIKRVWRASNKTEGHIHFEASAS